MNPSRLEIGPGPPLQGTFRPPGDKSVTHRAYLLGLLGEGTSVVERPNPGLDCESTLACVAALGAGVRRHAERIEIDGRGASLREPERALDCGNSGTSLRLLAGVVAAQPFLTVLVGDESLHRRPVARVVEPLRAMGARLHARAGDRLPPLVVVGGPLRPIAWDLPVASAQVASAILLAALHADGETVVTIPGPARDHTELMLGARGVAVAVEPLEHGGRRVRVRGRVLPRAERVVVPGDFSAAAFFLAAAAATPGAAVTVAGVGLNPSRTGLLDVLAAMGASIESSARGISGGEAFGDVTVRGPERLQPFDVPPAWVPRLVDEVPAWAIAAAAADGTSRLSGAAELRVKESDRLAALAGGLGRLGIAARERPDGLEIDGGAVRGGTVAAHDDHRIAMTFALLGARARDGVVVEQAGHIATSFPGFVETLAELGGRVRPAAEARVA